MYRSPELVWVLRTTPPTSYVRGFSLYLAEVSIHDLELFVEAGSQVQPLPFRGKRKERSSERLFGVVRVVALETMIDVSSQRCTNEWHRLVPFPALGHLASEQFFVWVVPLCRTRPEGQ